MSTLNKWCPIIQTENSQTKCMEDNCALWHDREGNCSINVIANNIRKIEDKLK